MSLERAQRIAVAVAKLLSPYCQRIQVAGSVRRKRPRVADIDFVLIPSDPWNLHHAIKGLGQIIMSGPKITRLMIGSTQVDLYFATPETWGTLLLIRTGSAENNIRLATHAKERGWHLAASGDGLFNEAGQRIAGESEESIYGALGLPYQKPWERN